MHTPEDSPKHCPKCQAPIPEGAPAGLCPKCLMAEVAAPTQPEAPPSDAPTLEEIAAAFPELEIVQVIGRGGMGVVFKVRQPRIERFAALKILPPHLAAQPDFAQRFIREARALARLNHPNIVGVYDFGEAGGFYYLLMEYIDGVNLREAERERRFTPEQALLVVPKLCEALQYAHDEGVLHRDIKPENILLDSKGRVKLADFGIAKLAGEAVAETSITGNGATLGTPVYMAPEQIEKPGTVDHRADIYSLGVVFYEMLTGELPLGRFAPPSKKTPIDTRIDDIVLRALEKERELRQQSATEMRTEVENVANHPAVAAPLGDVSAPGSGRLTGFGRAAAVFIAMGVATSMALPILLALGFRGKLNAVSAAAVAALFAIAAIVSGMIAGLRRPGAAPKAPKPWGLWNICGAIAVLSLPIAGIMTMLALPAAQKVGAPPIFGFAPFLIVPTVTFGIAAILGLIYRALSGRGAPAWLAALICCVLLLLLAGGGIVSLLAASMVIYESKVIPSPQATIKVSATEVQKLNPTEDPGDRVTAMDFAAPPGCVVEGRFFIQRGNVLRELHKLTFAAYSDPDWGPWKARVKVTAESLSEPKTFTRAVIGLQPNSLRGSESSESAAWPPVTNWKPVRAERKLVLLPDQTTPWELFRGESTGWTAGEPTNPAPALLVVHLSVHRILLSARQARATFSIEGERWWENLSMDQPTNGLKSTAVIFVDAAGKTSMEGLAIPSDQLAKRLRTIGLGKDAVIRIQADREAPTQSVSQIVAAVEQAGYGALLDAAVANPPELERLEPQPQP